MAPSRTKAHPEKAGIDIPAIDGTLLHITLHQEEGSARFTYESELEIQEHTPFGLRPLVQYKAGSVVRAQRNHGFMLHDKEPGLTIPGNWLITLSDWIEMLTEDSVDTWKVDLP